MDSDANASENPLNKTPFSFKNEKNGLIFTVHHTIEEAVPKKTDTNQITLSPALVRVRLVNACFSYYNTHFLAIDHRGNIFVFDLILKQLWKLNVKVERSSVIRNNHFSLNEFFIGTKYGELHLIDIESVAVKNKKRFCNFQIENISFPPVDLVDHNRKEIFLIYSNEEAILIDNATFNITHKLEFNDMKFSLKFCTYFPKNDKILTCFTNDIIHVWSGVANSNSPYINDMNINRSSLSTIRILYPLKLRDKQMKFKKAPELKIFKGLNHKDAGDDGIDNDSNNSEFEVKDYSNGLINSYSFSIDGLHLCLTTIDNFILILSTVTFNLTRLIQMNNIHCTQCCCISPGSNPTDMLLFGLTATVSDIVLIDCNDSMVKAVLQNGNAYKMENSNDGKMLFVVLKTGEINVYQNSKVINALKTTQKSLDTVKKIKKKSIVKANLNLPPELKNNLTRDRLMPILNEFGGYTEKYRHVIWSSLLELPNNKTEFAQLIKKGLHPSVMNFHQKYPLKDLSILRNLKKIISCLYFWSPVFGHCEFVPKLVFPFLCVYPNSLLSTFELIVTILLNHCQLWFEFAPLEPLNYLGMIENVLKYFDADLLEFYRKNKVSGKIYAWPLLCSAFSEVLDNEQWVRFWDNVVSNNLDYLVFSVVAYQIMQKNVIIKLKTLDSIQLFFHDQNIIDMKRFIRKIKDLRENCPANIQPMRYLKEFEKLQKGFYPKFENYPKHMIHRTDQEIEAIRLENSLLNLKMRELEKTEFEMKQKLEAGLRDEEHKKRLTELNKVYCDAITREEERIACQRKMLRVYQMELRNQNTEIENLVRESKHRQAYRMKEDKLNTLLKDIERARYQDEAAILEVEEESKEREMQLLMNKYKSKEIGEQKNHGTNSFTNRISKITGKAQRSRSPSSVAFKIPNRKSSTLNALKVQKQFNINYGISDLDLEKRDSHNIEIDDNYPRSIQSIQNSIDRIQSQFQKTVRRKSDEDVKNKKNLNIIEKKST